MSSVYYTLDWREIAGGDQSTVLNGGDGPFLCRVSQMFHVPIFWPSSALCTYSGGDMLPFASKIQFIC